MKQITVSDITIDVVRKNIQNLHLAVYPPTGRVRIATPLKIDDEAVRLFAISKLGWIKKHHKNFANQQRETQREYVSGESHYFEGGRYLLNVIYQNAKPKVLIRNKKDAMIYTFNVLESSSLIYEKPNDVETAGEEFVYQNFKLREHLHNAGVFIKMPNELNENSSDAEELFNETDLEGWFSAVTTTLPEDYR